MSRQLASILEKAGLLPRDEIRRAVQLAERRNRPLWDVILSEKGVSEEELADAISTHMHIPRVRLAATTIELEAVRSISEELARRYVCIPVSRDDHRSKEEEGKEPERSSRRVRPTMVLAMANPADMAAMQDVEFASGCLIRPVVATRAEVMDAIERHYDPEDSLQDLLANVSESEDLQIVSVEGEEGETSVSDARSQAEAAPVVKMVNLIVLDGIKQGSSDIHIEPGVNDIQVRNRVDGMLRDFMQVPKWLHGPLVSRLKILAKLDIAERRLPQDGRIKVHFQNLDVDLRVSTLPTHFGEKVVLRVLGSGKAVPKTTELGMRSEDLSVLKTACAQPQGMILVTGPTSSGKTTTLYSVLNEKKDPSINIITVEDPIEFQLPGINQVQVNVKAGLTFAATLRSILRQDPDVILLGEVRDLETAEIAFHAAMTGHLVFSTVHTNSTTATVARLLELGVDPYLVGTSVNLILAQRLVRKICLKCREEYKPDPEHLERLRINEQDYTFYHGAGCEACGKTGYSGREGVFELLRMTPTVKDLVNRKASELELRKAALSAGTRLLLQDALDKVAQGLTTVEEVLRVIQLQEDEIVRCPHCNSLINLEFSTCPYCLHTLKVVCQACGQELKPEWRICPYCNSKVTKMTLIGEMEKPAMLPAASGEGVAPQPAEAMPAAPTAAPAAPAQATGPAAAPAPSSAGLAAAPPLTAAVPPPGKAPKILVVDDDEVIRRLVTKALGSLPVTPEIFSAADGKEGLATAKKVRPDLVVLDIMMPGLSGFDVCQKLRSNIQTAFIPILMLTGNTDEESRTKGYMVGTDDYMSKPFSVPELHNRVTRLLRRTYGL
jgi:type IV pilus assembly protein PilB